MVKPSRKDWMWVLAISFVLIAIAFIQGPYSPPKPGPPITYTAIYNQTQSMTDAQRDEYFRKVRGYNLHGTGWVQEVKSNGVYIGSLPPFPGLPFRQGVVVKDTPRNIALKLNKGDKVEFSGNITKAEKQLRAFLVVSINKPTLSRLEK